MYDIIFNIVTTKIEKLEHLMNCRIKDVIRGVLIPKVATIPEKFGPSSRKIRALFAEKLGMNQGIEALLSCTLLRMR
jgi:hypothetical protein